MIKFIERSFKDERDFPGEDIVGVSMYQQADSIDQIEQRWKYRGTISLPRKEWADLRHVIEHSDASGMIYMFEKGS